MRAVTIDTRLEEFLRSYPAMQDAYRDASDLAISHPNSSLSASRAFAEHLLDEIADTNSVSRRGYQEKRADYIARLRDANCIPTAQAALFNLVRTRGDPATHRRQKANKVEALEVLGIIECLLDWCIARQPQARPTDVKSPSSLDAANPPVVSEIKETVARSVKTAITEEKPLRLEKNTSNVSVGNQQQIHEPVRSPSNIGDGANPSDIQMWVAVLVWAHKAATAMVIGLFESDESTWRLPYERVAPSEDATTAAIRLLKKRFGVTLAYKARLKHAHVDLFTTTDEGISPKNVRVDCYVLRTTVKLLEEARTLSEDLTLFGAGHEEPPYSKIPYDDQQRLTKVFENLKAFGKGPGLSSRRC